MPDITMCQNSACSKALECYRFVAIPGSWQSFFADMTESKCEHYMPLRLGQRTVLNSEYRSENKLPGYVEAALLLAKERGIKRAEQYKK